MHLHDIVELAHDLDKWPAGTAGTVVDEGRKGLVVEIVGPDGRTLALLDVGPEDVHPPGVTGEATVDEFLSWLQAEDFGDDPTRIRREAWG